MKTKDEILKDEAAEACLNPTAKILVESAMDVYADQLLHDQANKFQKQLTEVEQNWISQIPKWISVADRLPEEGGRYWCYLREITDLGASNFQWNCAYNEGEKRFSDCNLVNGEQVTHWTPLLEPPKK